MIGVKRAVLPVGLILSGLGVGILSAEALLRLVRPHESFGAAREMLNLRGSQEFTLDPVTGVRPVFGRQYTVTGTLRNHYALPRRAGTKRVLYLGDSVTRRGRIVKALRAIYGEQQLEHWNAGVESFNTVQEVEYYKRYARPVQPDHLVLTLHNNDFEMTPVAFTDADGDLVVYAPVSGDRRINHFLFRHSMIYRLAVGWRLSGNRDPVSFEGHVRDALRELKRVAATDGSTLTVLVLPIIDAHHGWSSFERRAHEQALRILGDLDIRFFDLLEPLNDALSAGVTIEDLQEQRGDRWHPSDRLGTIFASYLAGRRIFEGLSDPPPANATREAGSRWVAR